VFALSGPFSEFYGDLPPLEVICFRSQKPTKTEKENMKIATVLGLVAALAGFSLSSCGSSPEPAPVPAPAVEIPAK
jgi:hypothetical protein